MVSSIGSCTAPKLESSTVTGWLITVAVLVPVPKVTLESVTAADKMLLSGASLAVTTMGAVDVLSGDVPVPAAVPLHPVNRQAAATTDKASMAACSLLKILLEICMEILTVLFGKNCFRSSSSIAGAGTCVHDAPVGVRVSIGRILENLRDIFLRSISK